MFPCVGYNPLWNVTSGACCRNFCSAVIVKGAEVGDCLLCCLNNNDNSNNDDDDTGRRDSRFLTIFSLGRELSSTRTLRWPGCDCVQITCNAPGTYHVQQTVCHVVRRDSSAIKFDRAEQHLFQLCFDS